MGRTRRKTLPGDLIAMALYAMHGVEPHVEDMRHADRGAWDMPWGGHRVTENGDPRPAEGLDGHDGQALDFDGGGTEWLALDNNAAVDFGASDSFTHLYLLQVSDVANFPIAGDKRGTVSGTSGVGWSGIALDDGRWQGYLKDANGNIVRTRGSATIDDGVTHFVDAVVDRGADRQRTHVDGVEQADDDISTVGSPSSSSPLNIGRRATDNNYWPGVIGVTGVHPQWIAEEQAAFVDALLCGNVAPGTIRRLQSLVYGHRETGLKRRPIPYLAKHGLWESAYDVWDANLYPFGVDGEVMTQIANFAGPWRGLVERTETDKFTVNGRTTRGYPADSVQGSGSTEYNGADGFSATDSVIMWGVAQNITSGPSDLSSWESSANETFCRCRFINDGNEIRCLFDDENDNRNLVDLTAVDPTSNKVAFVAVADAANDRLRAVAKDSSGGSDSSVKGGSYTGQFKPDSQVIRGCNGPVYRRGTHVGQMISDAEQDALLDTLAATEGF